MTGACLQERLELQHQAEAEFAAERALVDEVVARIQQEDRMELAARRSQQADTKVWYGRVAAVQCEQLVRWDFELSGCACCEWCSELRWHTMHWLHWPPVMQWLHTRLQTNDCMSSAASETASCSRMSLQAYIANFLQQREETKAAARAAARAEDQKIKDYWSMVSYASELLC